MEALRHTSTLITLFDLDGGALFANPAAYAAYGSAEHPFAARFADPARCAPLLDQALAGETVAEVCETITLAGPRWHHLDARRVTDPVTGALGVILSERDVTERVEAERARAAAEQKAAMAEARQRFLSDMSHELRTPLNAVIGFSSLLKDADLPCGAGEQAEHIHASGRRLLDVVEEMIRLAESGDWSAETTLDPTFPAPDAAPGPEAACAAAGQGPRILYVDDNATNRALVTAMLGAQGLTCQTANDGAQGLEVARTGGWDLILMDIQMPVMDGVAATRAIRRLPDPIGATPIVAVTANTLAEQLAQYAAAGLDDVIAKPIDMATLFAKVAIWIDAGTKRGVGGCGADRDAVEG